MYEIEKLKKHIMNGCLSGLPPGFGTEKNERLHRLLNRSMLTGATRISVELAVAILTLLFHYQSSLTSPATHQYNSKVGCAVLIETHINGSWTERSMEYTFPFSSITEETTEQGTTATEPASSNVESADNVIVIAENQLRTYIQNLFPK